MSAVRVGFIGLGNMGGAQARCLVARGFALTVFDVHPPAMQVFADKARLAASIAELGGNAEVVGVMAGGSASALERARPVLDAPMPPTSSTPVRWALASR